MKNRYELIKAYLMLTNSARRLLRKLQKMAKKHDFLYPSLASLGEYCRLSRSTVIRALNRLCELGWLSKEIRGYHQTNLYCMKKQVCFTNFEECLKKASSEGKESNDTSSIPNKYTIQNPICNIGTYGTYKEKGGHSYERKQKIATYEGDFPSWLPNSLRIEAFRRIEDSFEVFIRGCGIFAIEEALSECRRFAKKQKINCNKGLVISKLKKYKDRYTSTA